jgi:hypothetical protein
MTTTDYEALEPKKFFRGPNWRAYNLMAEFTDMDTARRACTALEQAGFSGDNVSVLGRLGEEVSTATGLSADEQIVLTGIAGRLALGAALGALVAGVIAFLLGDRVFGLDEWLWVVIVAFCVLGAGIGAMLFGVGATNLAGSRAARHAGRPELEHAVVGVHTERREDLERAEQVLRGLAPVRLERLHRPRAADA